MKRFAKSAFGKTTAKTSMMRTKCEADLTRDYPSRLHAKAISALALPIRNGCPTSVLQQMMKQRANVRFHGNPFETFAGHPF